MLWLRRTLTFPLGLLLFVLLLVSLIVQQVTGTFFNPTFYTDELRDANFYEFVLVDVMTSAIDESRELNGETLPSELDENPLVTLGVPTEDIVSSLNKAVPPEWVQFVTEHLADQIGRYVTGERDDFQIDIEVRDQVATFLSEVRFLLREYEAYDYIYERAFDEVVVPKVEDILERKLSVELNITADQVVNSVRTTVPREWIVAQVENALDDMTPYALGEREDFEVRITLDDRARIALDEFKKLLRQADVYDTLYDDLIEPEVRKGLGETIVLPFGIVITSEEIASALRQVAPPQWVQAQVETVLDDATPYLIGESNSFATSLSLASTKLSARRVMEEEAIRKLNESLKGLPTCDKGRLPNLELSGNIFTLPDCLPPEVPIQEIANVMGAAIAEAMGPAVLKNIPNTVTLTHFELRGALVQLGFQDNIGLLDEIRETLANGLTYDETDFRKLLSDTWDNEAVQRQDDIRTFINNGWTYTHEDLRQYIAETSGEGAVDSLDRVRNTFGVFRVLRWLVFLPIIAILVAIGFLGGRNWSSRVAWAAGAVVIASAIVLIVFGFVVGGVTGPLLDDAETEALSGIKPGDQFTGTQSLVLGKAFEMAGSVVGGFTYGIAIKGLIVLIIGLIALGAALTWSQINDLIRRINLRQLFR